jgi:Domain of unknown function (DUF4383)
MVRTFALIFGIIYVLVGILGFIPALSTHPADAPHLSVESGHGYMLGLFPINILHNIVHLIIGLWGLLASRSVAGARLYAKVLAIAYALLAVLGLIPATNTTFGLIPIHGNDVWLHALSALIAAYFGFVEKDSGAPVTD